MSQLRDRPATREDIKKFSRNEDAPTLKAWIVELDDEPIALGGIAKMWGHNMGFFEINERGRELIKKNMYVRAYLFKAPVLKLRELKKMGINYIYADADMKFPRADELLERIGFEPIKLGQAFIWRAKEWQV